MCQRGAYWRADRPVLRALTDKRMTLIAADADVHPEGERCITIQPGHLSAQLQSALQVVRRALESPAQSRRSARQSWPAGQDWRAEQVACPFARHAGPAGCRRGERLARARGRSRSGSGIAPGARRPAPGAGPGSETRRSVPQAGHPVLGVVALGDDSGDPPADASQRTPYALPLVVVHRSS